MQFLILIICLLEADVNVKIVKEFIDNVKEKLEVFKGCSTKLSIPAKYL